MKTTFCLLIAAGLILAGCTKEPEPTPAPPLPKPVKTNVPAPPAPPAAPATNK